MGGVLPPCPTLGESMASPHDIKSMSHENNILTMESRQSPLAISTHPLSHPITLVIVPEDNLHNDTDLQQIVRTLSTPATTVAIGSQPKSLQAGDVVWRKPP